MKNPLFNIRAAADTAEIDIFGIIGESWWDDDSNDVKTIAAKLKEVEAITANKVVVTLNSLGGDVNQAFAIYETLRQFGDKLTVRIIGYCASAATVIAMAASNRLMSKYSNFLIHKCWSYTSGNENELEEELEAQRKVNATMRQLYIDTTGAAPDKIDELMEANNGKGRWLNFDEAKELGFVTGSIDEKKHNAMRASAEDLDNLGLPPLPKNKVSIPSIKSITSILFNKKTTPTMNRQKITALAMLAAIFADGLDFDENGNAILSQQQLEAINAKMAETEKDNSALRDKVAELENDKKALTTKRDELQALVDKHATATIVANGEDPKPAEDTYAEFQKNNPYYQALQQELV